MRVGWGGNILSAPGAPQTAPRASFPDGARGQKRRARAWGEGRARARRRGQGGALRSHNRPDGTRVPEGAGIREVAAAATPAGPRARRRRWLRSLPLLLPAALALPRAAGDGGGVCGKPCVSAVTWAGRGLGDVRGLCVAMCVGFGAAPAQPKGAGERRRRRRAQVRLRLTAGTRRRRREARGAHPPGSPTAATGAVGNSQSSSSLPGHRGPSRGFGCAGPGWGRGQRGSLGGCSTADHVSLAPGGGRRQGRALYLTGAAGTPEIRTPITAPLPQSSSAPRGCPGLDPVRQPPAAQGSALGA